MAKKGKATFHPLAPTPEHLVVFAKAMAEQALMGYVDGELDLRGALRLVFKCTRECDLSVQIGLLGALAFRALEISPDPDLLRRRPSYPKVLRMSAANLVIVFEEDGALVTADSGALDNALVWLEKLEIMKVPTRETLYKWYLERKRIKGEALKPGRPSKP